jgi:hypothetical protein
MERSFLKLVTVMVVGRVKVYLQSRESGYAGWCEYACLCGMATGLAAVGCDVVHEFGCYGMSGDKV